MAKVCVIGDSHVAALRQGWPAIKGEFPDMAFTWFAANQTLYEGLVLDSGTLLATTKELIEMFEYTSGGERAIDAGYDLYLLIGLRLAPQIAFAARKDYRSRHGDIPLKAFETEFPDLIEAELRKSTSAHTLAMLRTITKAPTGLIAVPRPHSFDEPQTPAPGPAVVRRSRLLAGAFETACRRVAEESGAIFLPQPAETLTDENAMVSRSVFAARAKEDPDRGHKNPAYGGIVLREALRAMAPASAPFRDGVG